MNEEILIKSVADGKSVKVNEMVEEFQSQNQDNSIFAPIIKFSDDCLSSKNVVSFLCQIKDINPLAIFETIFPKDATDPSIKINSIVNYLNAYPKTNNRFILKIGGTDEKQRKEKFSGEAHGLSDISKMFVKQPISKNKPVLELSSEIEVDVSKLSGFFPPNRFAFYIKDGKNSSLEKKMISAGYEKDLSMDIAS